MNGILADRLSVLRLRFLDVIETRLAEVEALRDLVEARDGGEHAMLTNIDAIRFAAHKTVGVAATLGFVELGMLSQRVELAVMDFNQRSEPPTTIRMILALTDEMLAEMGGILTNHGR